MRLYQATALYSGKTPISSKTGTYERTPQKKDLKPRSLTYTYLPVYSSTK